MASISSSNTILPPSWPSKNIIITDNPRPKKMEDGEIDVFRADKYFNGVVPQEKEKNHHKGIVNFSKLNLDSSNNGKDATTPSIYSESSCNSQSALIKRVQGNLPARSKNSKNSAFLLSCYYCCDSKSVQLEDQGHGKIKRNMENNGNDDDELLCEKPMMRTFFKTSMETAEITRLNKLKKIQLLQSREDEDNKAEEDLRGKKSLEVFGVDEGIISKRFSLEKRLNMLSWDAIPKSPVLTTTAPAVTEPCNDTDSDASSDLFEIDCTVNPASKNNLYAPSEASIEWSVVTASAAADCTTACPDPEEKIQSSVIASVKGCRPGLKAAQKTIMRPAAAGGMFAGCKSQKSVRVAEDVCIRSSNNNATVKRKTRFQAEANKLAATNNNNNNSIRQSRSIIPSSDILYLY